MNMKDIACIRIAMLGHKRIPSREGGIEVVVEELATRLVSLGHEVTCFNRIGHHVSGEKYTNLKTNTFKGVKLKEVFTVDRRGFSAMISSISAASLAAFGTYDLVHFHAEGSCAMLWLPKLLGKRCIATIHGLDHRRAKWGRFASAYILFGERVAVRHADEIIVLSEGIQTYFMNTYSRKTRFIPNGVNRPNQRDVNKIKICWGLVKDSYILFLGRIVPEKGLKYLIEAFKETKTDKKLVIAGGSSDTDSFVNELHTICAGDNRVIFTGFVQDEILDELYSNAYIYTLPTDLEGMPLSLLEAMSYGNCCIVSSIFECTSVVEDKAVVFEKGNVLDLKDKIQELCDSPKIVQHYKEEAADFICKKYCWDDVVKQTVGLYSGGNK